MPQTLLLADDNLTSQRVIELTFADEDITVVSVSDGDQAIARLNSAPPDILLADVGLPGKSGYEVAEHVKRTPGLAHIPVVLLTGAFEPVDQVKATAAGCDGVLSKPFEPQLVIGRVRELLGRPAQAAPAADPTLAPPASILDFVPAHVPKAAPVPEAPARVEDYFDRLDAAFASFGQAPAPDVIAPAALAPVSDELDWITKRPQPVEPPPLDVSLAFEVAPPEPVEPVAAFEPFELPESAPVVHEVLKVPEVLAVPEVPEVPEVPKVHEVPEPAPREPREPGEPGEPREPLELLAVVSIPSTGRSLPSIADAFAAILSAEQNVLGVRPEWPAPSAAAGSAAAPAPLVITDDLVNRVASRVLEQLSDRVVRETVASIASDAAERLVKEEIERIKASIK